MSQNLKRLKRFLREVKLHKSVTDLSLQRYETILREYEKYGVNKTGTERWLRAIKKQKPKTIANKLIVARMYIRWLMDNGEIKTDYLRGVKAPQEHRLPKYLNDEQFKEAIEDMSPYYRALAIFLRGTGLRIGEYVNLSLKDIEFAGDYAVIKVRGKRNKERYLRVRREVVEQGIEAGIFETKRVVRSIERYFKKRGFTPHTLRHTFAKKFLEAGAPINTLQAVLGHEAITTTAIYTKISSRDITIPAF